MRAKRRFVSRLQGVCVRDKPTSLPLSHAHDCISSGRISSLKSLEKRFNVRRNDAVVVGW